MAIDVFSAVAWSITCVLWFYTGLLKCRQKGYKQGRTEFEQLFKEINYAEAEEAHKEGYRQGFKAGIKSIEDVINERDRVLTDLVDDDLCEDLLVGALSCGVSSEAEAVVGDEDVINDALMESDTFTGGRIIGPLAEMNVESEYDCKRCAFAETPYCEKCNYVALAGGGVEKPSMFTEAAEIDCTLNCAENIKKMLDEGEVISLRTVIFYNSIAMRRPAVSDTPPKI